jgi:uncharacterized membrane protein
MPERGQAGGARLRLARALRPLVLFLAALAAPVPAAPPAAAQDVPLALAADSLRVVYWPGDRGLAERTLRAARAPLHLPGLPDAAPYTVGTIVLAPTLALYDSAAGGAAPGWSAGIARPDERLIVLPAFSSPRTPDGDPIAALRHERVHLALHAHLGDIIPRWFDEGYATWAAGEWDEGTGWEIRLALLRGAAPPLDSLTLDWPARASDARLAYLLSASAVRFLSERGGERGLAAFFNAWRASGSFDSALRTVYLTTPATFEAQWRAMVKRRYGWLLAISQVGVFWVVLTGLVLLLGIARRRRDRQTLARMEAEERAEDAARAEAGEEGSGAGGEGERGAGPAEPWAEGDGEWREGGGGGEEWRGGGVDDPWRPE